MSDTLGVPMNPLRGARTAALIACLGLFLLGSNYCLLSAWSGTGDMACLAMPAPEAKPSACGKCSGRGAEKPADAGRSCCPDPVVAPSAPAVDKPSAEVSWAAPVTLVIESTSTPALTSHRGR